MTLKLGMQHRVLKYYQVYSNGNTGLTLTYFMAKSNLEPYAFVWEKGKTMDFSETIVVYDLKLATDDRSDKKFLLTSKFCPLGAVCPLSRGYIQILNRGARWLSGRVSDSGARGPGFETYRRRVVSLSKTLYSPKVLVNYPGSDGSVPTWLKNCWLGR